MFPAQAGTQTVTLMWESIIWIPAFAVERQENILVLRQAQDKDEWEIPNLSLFLMLSLSKHEEVALPLVHHLAGIRKVQREGWDLGIKSLAVVGQHLETARHTAR